MSEPRTAGPIPDDALVRYLDGESQPREASLIERLDPSSRESSRLWELRETSRAFGDAVASIDAPPLPALVLEPRLWLPKAAAIALLFAAGTAAALPPTRTMLVDAATRILRVGAPDAPPPRSPTSGRATIAIPVTGPEFTVELRRRQAGGVLRIRPGSGSEVTAIVGGAEVVVLPAALRVLNGPESTADLVITVPELIERIRLKVGAEERLLPRSGGAWLDPIPLGPDPG